MTAPLLTKAWTITPNLRRAYVSLNDLASWSMYQNKVAMVARGWAVVFSSDGVNGPSGSGDTTDRWSSEASATVRSTVDAGAQSWIVLQNADGLQVLLTYLGATDDVWRIAYSPTGLYTLAGTTTHRPTAADEVICNGSGSVVSNATSLDRVMSIWCSDDTRHWSFAIFRAGGMLIYQGVERINNLCAPNVFSHDGSTERPYVGYRWGSGGLNRGNMANEGAGHTVAGNTAQSAGFPTTGVAGTVARVFTAGASRLARVAGGLILIAQQAGGSGYSSNTQSNTPALQGAASSPLLPLYWSGDKAANIDGYIGYPIDWWQMITASNSVPSLSDMVPGYDPGDTPGVDPLRTNWLVVLGSACVRPWRNAAATLEMT